MPPVAPPTDLFIWDEDGDYLRWSKSTVADIISAVFVVRDGFKKSTRSSAME